MKLQKKGSILILKYFSIIFKNFITFLIIISVVGVAIFGYSKIGGVFNSIQENYQQYSYQENFDDSYQVSEKTNEEILTQVFELSDEELSSMTKTEKMDYAYEESFNMGVYTLDLNVLSDTQGNFHCANIESLERDDNFRQFKLDTKWEMFFSPQSTIYDVQYRSNVFDKDSYYELKDVIGRVEFTTNNFGDLFPFDYFQNSRFSYQVTESDWSLVNQRVYFEDKVQIVLPEENGLPENRDLIYLVRIKSDIVNSESSSESNYKIHELPLRIQNGELSLKSTEICGNQELKNFGLELSKLALGGVIAIS